MLKNLIIFCCFFLTACASDSLFTNYPSQILRVKQELQSTNNNNLNKLINKIDDKDGLLYAQEVGRAYQINGDFLSSFKYYKDAIDKYNEIDDKALISASRVAATGTSLLLNDNAIPYQGYGYEKIILHQYQALNYLFMQNINDALVEVRRANELQSIEQKRFALKSREVANVATGNLDGEIAKLNTNLTNSFLSAYSYYITGLLYEMSNQQNDAFIDYKKALTLAPQNRYIQRDLVRLAKTLSMPDYGKLKRSYGDTDIPSNAGTLVVLAEVGFVSAKQSFTLPLWINGLFQTTTMATYPYTPPIVDPIPISLNSKLFYGNTLTNIDSLARTALKEEMPLALSRQITRGYTKATLNRSLARGSNNQNDAQALGTLAMQVFNVVSEQADRRSWLTLPAQVQIARKYVAPGNYELKIGNNTQNIKIDNNKITLVWAIIIGQTPKIYTLTI